MQVTAEELVLKADRCLPLHRRIPKSGFTNAAFKKSVDVINVGDLDSLGSAEISREALVKLGYLSSTKDYIKLLSMGEVKNAITITVDLASKKAIEKIEKSGGKVIIHERKKYIREKK